MAFRMPRDDKAKYNVDMKERHERALGLRVRVKRLTLQFVVPFLTLQSTSGG